MACTEWMWQLCEKASRLGPARPRCRTTPSLYRDPHVGTEAKPQSVVPLRGPVEERSREHAPEDASQPAPPRLVESASPEEKLPILPPKV